MAKRVRVSGLPPIKPTRIVSTGRGPRGRQGPPGQYIPPANTITVAESGGDYTSIQQAIDRCVAEGGGTVDVHPGTYAENITVPDGVTVVGHGIPVLDGNLTIETGGWVRFLKVLGETTGICTREYISLLNGGIFGNPITSSSNRYIPKGLMWDGRRYPHLARAYLEIVATKKVAGSIGQFQLYNLTDSTIYVNTKAIVSATTLSDTAFSQSNDIRSILWPIENKAIILYAEIEFGALILYDARLVLDLLE